MTKKILTICCLWVILLNSLKAENLEMNLADFATFASQTNKINILLDDSLKDENIIFIISDENSFLLEAFEKAVNLKGLELIENDKFYYVRKRDIYVEQVKYRPIKLNFVKYEDIQNFLKVYDTSIKYEFIKTSKTLLIASKEEEFNSINQMIKSIDILPKQLKLKVTIIDTNLDKLKQLGADATEINLQDKTNFFFNLVSYPFSVKNDVSSADKDNFYTFLKFLNQNGSTEFLSNPILSLSDEQSIEFRVGNKVPVLTGSSSLQSTTYTTSNAYEYKDVGLEIKATPHIYADNNVYLDLELKVSNIVSNNNNLVETSEKYIKQQYTLTTNKLLVLTGLNKKDISKSNYDVPLLSDIPFLGWLFKYESTKESVYNLSVVFELISEDDFTTDNFAVLVPNTKF
jgi:general secretion pathway protein D